MRRELEKIRVRIKSAEDVLRRLRNTEYSISQVEELPILKRKYEGKYFKYHNGFNSNEKWWMYLFVKKVNSTTEIVCDKFEENTRECEFKLNDITSERILGVKITKREYNAALRKFLNKANRLKK